MIQIILFQSVDNLENYKIDKSVGATYAVNSNMGNWFCNYQAAAKTGHVLIIDEDYEGFGLSGELAAIILEAGISVKYARVCTQTTIPYALVLEKQTLPNVERIISNAKSLLRG